VNLLQSKITSFWRKLKSARPFFDFRHMFKKTLSQGEIDKRLVYSLSPHKIPNRRQFKHLKRFLNPREALIIKICLLVILINAGYLGFIFLKNRIQYLPISGGEYIEGLVGYPKTINPLYAVNRDVDSDLSALIYSRLFKYDKNGVLVNDLVDTFEIKEGGKEYIVKIKDNVQWHNGEKLNADDIIFTFNLIKNPDYRSPLRSAVSIANIEKIDELTIKFSLSEPYAPFLDILTFGILPKNLWENISSSAAVLSDLNLKPIGSGPYKFKSLVKNKIGDLKEYKLEINDNYYGQKPYLKNISFIFFPDYQTAISALNNKQIAGLSYLPLALRQEALAKDSLNFYNLSQPQIVSLFFNGSKNKILAEKDVRIALNKAIDKDRIISDIFQGTHTRADGPIPDKNLAYNQNITKYNYSPAESSEEVKDKAVKIVLTVIDSGANVAVAEKIKEYWSAIGVETTLNIITGERSSDIIKNRDFEVLLYGESIGGDPDVYVFWHSSQAGSKGLNLAGYNNSEADKLLEEARISINAEERITKYKKFQEIITADLPVIFLYSPSYTYVQSHDLKGFGGTAIIEPSDRFSGVSDWYLKTKKKLTHKI